MTTTPGLPRAAFTKGVHWTQAETSRCRGINHHDIGDLGTCDDCTAFVVRVTRPGRSPYLVNAAERGHYCWGRHECDPAIKAAVAEARAVRLAAGSVEKGQKVRVVKGRKVPVGTTGTVTWVGEDSYGKARLGIRDDAGTIRWTAASNVEPVTE
jgi:hypothetical protein